MFLWDTGRCDQKTQDDVTLGMKACPLLGQPHLQGLGKYPAN